MAGQERGREREREGEGELLLREGKREGEREGRREVRSDRGLLLRSRPLQVGAYAVLQTGWVTERTREKKQLISHES